MSFLLLQKIQTNPLLILRLFNFNKTSTISPTSSNLIDVELRNFSFTIEPNAIVEFYYKFQSPNKTRVHSNQITFSQLEKFPRIKKIWTLVRIILGQFLRLLSLPSIYSQIKDKTTLYFGVWLMSAFLAVFSQDVHDGSRLLSFLLI